MLKKKVWTTGLMPVVSRGKSKEKVASTHISAPPVDPLSLRGAPGGSTPWAWRFWTAHYNRARLLEARGNTDVALVEYNTLTGTVGCVKQTAHQFVSRRLA